MALLEVRNINTFLGGNHIIRGVSIKVDTAECVYVLGRNGAGKTTLLKSIVGLYQVSSGEIIFDGKEITNLKPHEIISMGIGYSPEGSRVFSNLTVRENIRLALSTLKRLSKGKIREEEILKEIYEVFPELKKLENRRAFYLSGGERKILALARALALKPRLLIIDEPLEGLSPLVRARLRRAFESIAQQDRAMLIAESNLNFVLPFAKKCYLMDRGEVIYEGDPKTVSEYAKSIYLV